MTGSSKVGEQHLYRVWQANTNTNTNTNTSSVECLTCTSHAHLSPCLYAGVELSPDYSGYVLNCLGPDIPYTAVFDLPSNQLRFVMDTNQHIKNFLASKDLPYTEIFEMKPLSTKDHQSRLDGNIRVKVLLPARVALKEGERTGLVVMLPAHREAALVTSRWSCDLDCLLTGAGYGVALLDLRQTSLNTPHSFICQWAQIAALCHFLGSKFKACQTQSVVSVSQDATFIFLIWKTYYQT